MKKQILCVLFLLLCASAVFAGRQTDMEFRLLSPQSNTTILPGGTFMVRLQATNTGGDDLQGGDTILLKLIIDGASFPFANPSGGPTDTFLRISGFKIAPGDSAVIFTQAFGFNDSDSHNFCLEGFIKSPTSTVSINDPNDANNKSCARIVFKTVGIATVDEQENLFEVFPMPANDVIHWNSNYDFKPATIALYNLAGTCVQRAEVAAGNNTLNVRHLPAGMYLLQATGNDGRVANWRMIKE